MSAPTITEFLLARIAEDETDRLSWHVDDCERFTYDLGPCDCGLPARMKAECEAKRRIVDEHPLYRGPRLLAVDSSGIDFACERCHATSSIDSRSVIEALGPCVTLLALASVYADYPDFDPAWRP